MKPVTIDIAPSGRFVVDLGFPVEIPATALGARCLARILQARHMAPDHKVGSPGAPTQYIIETWLRENESKALAGLEPIDLEEYL